MNKIIITLLSVSLLCTMLQPGVWASEPNISAASAILIDGETGRVLYAKNADEPRLIASITKLMTALIAVESQPDISQTVVVAPEWTGVEGSSMYLRPGEEITLEGLLYGLLLSSGNDAAVAIAAHCGGDVDTFVDWMNDRAAEIGMEHSHFNNPNGLNDDAHYSTATDMAKLAQVVMKHEALARIVGTKNITIAGRSLSNHNKLLWQYEGCVGMKTGYTERAGRTLVSSVERDGQRLIAVTLNAPNDWGDHVALYNNAFAMYHRMLLARADKIIRSIAVSGSLTRFVPVRTATDVYYPLTDQERVRAEVLLSDSVDAPVVQGQIAGSITFYLGDKVIGESYLLYERSVKNDRSEEAGLLFHIKKMLHNPSASTQTVAAFWCGLTGIIVDA